MVRRTSIPGFYSIAHLAQQSSTPRAEKSLTSLLKDVQARMRCKMPFEVFLCCRLRHSIRLDEQRLTMPACAKKQHQLVAWYEQDGAAHLSTLSRGSSLSAMVGRAKSRSRRASLARVGQAMTSFPYRFGQHDGQSSQYAIVSQAGSRILGVQIRYHCRPRDQSSVQQNIGIPNRYIASVSFGKSACCLTPTFGHKLRHPLHCSQRSEKGASFSSFSSAPAAYSCCNAGRAAVDMEAMGDIGGQDGCGKMATSMLDTERC